MKDQLGPKFIQYLDPVLKTLKELGGSGRAAEVIEKVAQIKNVSEAARQEKLASGAPRFDNQVQFARMYLVWAGYLDSPKYGIWRLTEKGQTILEISNAAAIQLYKEQQAIHSKKEKKTNGEDEDELPTEPYKEELLKILKSLPAAGFELLCKQLLLASNFEQVDVTGKSGDGGIDGIGIVKVNQFVTFKVLFQCKRYTDAVSSGQVRDFRGAMQGRADKAIILTTGTFTKDAQREAVRDGVPPIELVDGERLIQLFEGLEFGLTPRKTFDVNVDFFKPFSAAVPEKPS